MAGSHEEPDGDSLVGGPFQSENIRLAIVCADPRRAPDPEVGTRAKIGYLVGYEASNIWRIWLPDEKIARVRDVVFDESRQYDPKQASSEEVSSIPRRLPAILPEDIVGDVFEPVPDDVWPIVDAEDINNIPIQDSVNKLVDFMTDSVIMRDAVYHDCLRWCFLQGASWWLQLIPQPWRTGYASTFRLCRESANQRITV